MERLQDHQQLGHELYGQRIRAYNWSCARIKQQLEKTKRNKLENEEYFSDQ
jgi:hypothetical protein